MRLIPSRFHRFSLLYPVFLKRDFYEVALPRKNEQIHITPQNAEFLYSILTRYENRKVEYDNGKIYENGKELTSCRLTQSYYWGVMCICSFFRGRATS